MDIMNNNTSNNKLVTVLFKNPTSAENAYNYLTRNGFDKNNITVIMSDDTRRAHFENADMPEGSLGSKAVEGMGVGGAIGGTIGAVAAAVAAIGTSLIIPGLGLVVAGPIAAGLAGAGAGSAIGGMVGALTGAGISDERAKQYEDEIKNGGILVGIEAPADQMQNLENELNKMNSSI